MLGTRWVRAAAVIGVGALVLAACGSDDKESGSSDKSTTTAAAVADRGNVDGTLKLGLLVPETGSLSAILQSLATPVQQIALQEINAAGGFNGKPVVVVQADDGTDATVASNSLDKLANQDKVDAILGPASSGTAAGILEKIKSFGLLTCSGSNTAQALDTANADTGGYYFRTAPSDTYQGPALAQLIVNDGKSKVAIVARNDDYGAGFAKSLGDALKKQGATVTTTVKYDPKGSNFDADVQKAADSKPDAVAVLGFNDDGAKIISAMIAKNLGPSQIPTYTADGMQSSKFGQTVNPSNPGVVAGITGTAPAAAPTGVTSPFDAAFKATGVDPIFSAYYYDCTNLVALSAVAAKSDDAAKMKDALPKLLSGDTDCQTFKDCKAALDAGKTIHYRGASSQFDSWLKFQPGGGTYETWKYDSSAKPQTFGEQISIKG